MTKNENEKLNTSAADRSSQYFETTEVNPDKIEHAYLKNKARRGAKSWCLFGTKLYDRGRPLPIRNLGAGCIRQSDSRIESNINGT